MLSGTIHIYFPTVFILIASDITCTYSFLQLSQFYNPPTSRNERKVTSAPYTDFTDMYPEMNMTAPEIISFMGYPAETHTVTTPDGYVLAMHRIPLKSSSKPPVLLQHGLLSSSHEFIINYPNQSLAYILSDAGFDVWLNNMRGNKYSMKHIKYSSNDQEFWDFPVLNSMQDLVDTIDYVLNATGHKQLYYVGNSLGCLMIFTTLAKRSEYNSKVKYVIAMAPVFNTRYMRGLFPVACNYLNVNGLPQSWQKQVPPNVDQFNREFARLCSGGNADLCFMALTPLLGAPTEYFNRTRITLYAGNMLGGTSGSIIRMAAEVVSSRGTMKEADYGPRENMRRYGQAEPKGFDLSQVTSPVFIYHSDGDFFSRPQDVKYLRESLGNCQGSHAIEQMRYSHGDFIFATNNKIVLHDKIVARLNAHEAQNPHQRIPT